MVEPSASRTLVDDLLAEQRDLTAAARFAAWRQTSAEPAPARWYRHLIPLTKPQPGQQYAFDVDLDRCSGCKACVSACHSLNGLDDGEAWRDTGLLVSDDWRRPYQQTITTACHHCVDPACLNGCPTLAYDKDPLTGIVRHLADQCIGCQYCVLKCPYDAPKYSARRGIVRKCDLCSNRLAAGEAPACVQACPNEAIRITLRETKDVASEFRGQSATAPSRNATKSAAPATSEISARASTAPFLPAAPAPDYTLPTTRYKSSQPIPDSARAADREELHPQPAHTPLVFMLVLSQLSAGLFLFDLLASFVLPAKQAATLHAIQTLAAFVVGASAMLISLLHLGRPLGAWRAFLGLRQSWLSREIVVFGLFLPLAGLYTASTLFPASLDPALRLALGAATALAGLLGVFSSAMLYHDTHRDFWRLPLTGGKFFGTTLLLGAVGTLLTLAVCEPSSPASLPLALAGFLALAGAWKLAVEHRVLRRLPDDDFSPRHKTALLLAGRFGLARRCQIAALLLGAILLPAPVILEIRCAAPGALSAGLPAVAFAFLFALCLAGELMERRLFFLAVQPVKMPGTIAS